MSSWQHKSYIYYAVQVKERGWAKSETAFIMKNSESKDKKTELVALWARPFDRLNKIQPDQQTKEMIVEVLNGRALQSRIL